MKNTKYHSGNVKKTCENKLGIKFKSGKEFNGWYWLKNRKVVRITVMKGKKFIKPKTYKSMAKRLKLEVEEFDELLECPLSEDKYIK